VTILELVCFREGLPIPWEKDKTQKTATFTRALENMKILAEGGTLPPAPPRGGR
jgi:hypothetical protein